MPRGIHGSRDIKDETVESVDIKDGTIVDSDISSTAAISQSKISQSSGWITDIQSTGGNSTSQSKYIVKYSSTGSDGDGSYNVRRTASINEGDRDAQLYWDDNVDYWKAGIANNLGKIATIKSSKTQGEFYFGITDPSNTDRLNYDGNFHCNSLYVNQSSIFVGGAKISYNSTSGKFEFDTGSGSTPAAEVRIAGDIGSGTVKYSGQVLENGAFFGGSTAPTDITPLNYNGYFKATKVYNAIFNDIVDFIEIPEDIEIEYGKAYILTPTYVYRQSINYLEMGIVGIASDTYGFGVGKKEKIKQLPIAIGGFVLAYVDKEYAPGIPLTVTQDGYLTEILHDDKSQYPERIVATFWKPEKEKEWNGIKVNNRMWVKVK
ncbi:MAG: hypothetical protein ACOC3V_04225 [bacterium]